MVLLAAMSALLIAALLCAAACGWLLAGHRLWRPRRRSPRSHDAQAAFRRHPAARSRDLGYVAGPFARVDIPCARRPLGPDDDPEFISALERLIRGGGQDL